MDKILKELQKRAERVLRLEEAYNNSFVTTCDPKDRLRRNQVNETLVSAIGLTQSRYSVKIVQDFLDKLGVNKTIISGARYYSGLKEKEKENV